MRGCREKGKEIKEPLCDSTANTYHDTLLTHSPPVLVGVAELLAQLLLVVILSLFYNFLKCNLTLKYYGHTTEIDPLAISKAPVMFKGVTFSVTRVEGNTTFLSYSCLTAVI
jgi:hypothetical protein